MDKNKNSISRKNALKRMGGLTLGMPFLPSMLGNLSFESKKETYRKIRKRKNKRET